MEQTVIILVVDPDGNYRLKLIGDEQRVFGSMSTALSYIVVWAARMVHMLAQPQ